MPLIAALARKLDWEAEQHMMNLSRRQFALLMLCSVSENQDIDAVARYVDMDGEVLRAFLARAYRTLAPPDAEPEEETPARKRRRR